jgi:hypothetical protein
MSSESSSLGDDMLALLCAELKLSESECKESLKRLFAEHAHPEPQGEYGSLPVPHPSESVLVGERLDEDDDGYWRIPTPTTRVLKIGGVTVSVGLREKVGALFSRIDREMSSRQRSELVSAFFSGDASLFCQPSTASLVVLMLDAGAPIEGKDDGWFGLGRPLHAAAAGGHTALVSLCLQRGARIDAANSSQSQALHIAALYGQHEVVRVLLAAGADPRATNARGRTPFDLTLSTNERPPYVAECAGHALSMDLLFSAMGMQEYSGWDMLAVAVRRGDVQSAAALLASGSVGSSRLLALALANRDDAMTYMLVSAGMPVDSGLLLVAIEKFNKTGVALMLAAGCKPTLEALKAASYRSQLLAATMLVAAGLVVDDWAPVLDKLGCMMDFKTEPKEGAKAYRAAELCRWRAIPDDASVGLLHINRARRQLIRDRTFEICTALQTLELDALCMTHIIEESCRCAADMPMHIIWDLVTTIKHFGE